MLSFPIIAHFLSYVSGLTTDHDCCMVIQTFGSLLKVYFVQVLIASRLSTRLLIFQSVGWQGVAPNSVPLRNAKKGVACAQTSVPFRNVIKTSILQKVVYTYISSVFLAL